jgi:hypothetical protein
MVSKLKAAIPAVILTLLVIKFVPQVKSFILSA